MIIKNGVTISSVLKGTTPIQVIKKGLETVFEAFRLLTISGKPPLTLEKSVGKDLEDYKIYGESVQDGTPTPETPIEVESVGEKTNNLINVNNIKGSAFTINGNEVQFSIYAGNSSANSNSTLQELCPNIEVGKTYILYFDTDVENSNISIGSYAAANFWGNKESRTIKETDLSTIVRFGGGGGTSARKITFSNIQIVEEATDIYEPYGYKIPVKISGKNCFNGQWEKGFINNNTGMNSSSSSSIRTANYIELKPNTKYYVTVPSGNNYPFTYKKDKSLSRYLTLRGKSFSFTTTEDEYYFRIAKYGDPTIPANVQIEVGSVATEYEPYIEPTTTNIYLNEPLRKTENVVDYIDFKNKQLKSQIKEIIFNGKENWALNTALAEKGVNRFHLTLSDAYYGSGVNINNQCKCSHFDTTSNMATANSQGIKNGVYVYTKIAYFYTDASVFPDLATWKEWLTNNNVTLQYKIAEESTTTIELPTLATSKGTNIVDTETSVKPSNLEIEYFGLA